MKYEYPKVLPIEKLNNDIYNKLKEKYPKGLIKDRSETADQITQIALEHFKPVAEKVLELLQQHEEEK